MDIEIRYFDDCPNWRATDRLLRALVGGMGLDATIVHRRVETPADAERLGFIGSPTILIDGTDPFAAPGAPIGLGCRIYRTDDGFAGAPSETQLRAALTAAS